MGAVQSHPRWDRQYPAGWDEWGYVPPGAVKPSQHVWSEWYTQKRPPSNDPTYLYNYGNLDDIMQNFGEFSFDTKTANGGQQLAGFTMAPGVGQPGYTPTADQQRCNPLTFPNCSFETARNENAVTVTPYKNNVMQELKNGTWVTGTPGQPVDLFQRWQTAVGDLYQKYEGHGFDYVYSTNTNDTSAYDPCDQPTLIEALVPFALAGGGTFLFATYGNVAFDVLPMTCKPVLLLSTFVTLWEYGRGSVNFFINPDLHHSSMQRAASAASMGLTYTLGAWGGDYYSNQISFNPNPYFEPLGGVTSMYLLVPQLQPKLALAISVSTFGGFGLGLVSFVWHYVSRFFCGIANWGADACDDNSKNPDARRWDVASLCARLTDYACESEGWARSDPRAEFVFRSLMTQFDWQFAAVDPTVTHETMYNRMKGTNPVGSIVQVQTNDYSHENFNGWSLRYTEDIFGLDNNARGSSWNGISGTSSTFACQNFDTMFCDPDAQGTCNAGGDDQATRQFSQTMRTWLDAAINKAYDPNNLEKMSHIPGWSNKKTRFDYDIDTYLATCNKDFDETAGTGFNDVRSRGEWAQDCDLTKVADSVAKTTVLANSFFAEKTLSDAMDALLQAKWNDQNMIAWAHYIYYRKGLYQTDDFDRWCGEGDQRVDLLWSKPNHGFTATPTEGGKLDNLIPKLQMLPTKLQPHNETVLPMDLVFKEPFQLTGFDKTALQKPFEGLLQPETLLLSQTLDPVTSGDYGKWNSFCATLLQLMKTKGATAAAAFYTDQKDSGLTWQAYTYCDISAEAAGIFNVVACLANITPVSQAFYVWFTCYQTGEEPAGPPWAICSNVPARKDIMDAYLLFGAQTWVADPDTYAALLPEQQTQVQEWLGGGLISYPWQLEPSLPQSLTPALPQPLGPEAPQQLNPLPPITQYPWRLEQPLTNLLQPLTNLLAPLTNLLQPLTSTTPAPRQLLQQNLTPATSGDSATWHNFVTQLVYVYQQQGLYYAQKFYQDNARSGFNWSTLDGCKISASDSGALNAMRAIMEVSPPNAAFEAWNENFAQGDGKYAPVWANCVASSNNPFEGLLPPQEFINAYTFWGAQTFIAVSNFYEQLSASNQQIISGYLATGD